MIRVPAPFNMSTACKLKFSGPRECLLCAQWPVLSTYPLQEGDPAGSSA